jgi:hypothetical protein
MKTRWVIVALLLGLELGWVPATRAVRADGDRIARLISRLASPKFGERRRACRELDAIGEPALDALRKARGDADLETCRLAKELVARIERRLDAAAVLAPTRVRLVCKDMPVRDAVAELAKKAKIEILIDPASQAKLAQRKVTLDTGEVTFWEALDALCQKAGLVETAWQNPNQPTSYLRSGAVILPAPVQKPLIVPLQPAIKVAPQPPMKFKLAPQPMKKLPARPPKGKAPQPQAPKAPKKVQAQPQKRKAAAVQAAKRAALGRLVAAPAPAGVNLAQVQLQRVFVAQAVVAHETVWLGPQAVDYSRIVLADGKPEPVATCYAGTFRIRARLTVAKDRRSAVIAFEVAAEPRHLGWDFVGDPRLDRARDDRGQVLTLLVEPRPHDVVMGQWVAQRRLAALIEVEYLSRHAGGVPLKRTVQIQVQLGDRSARRADIAGQLTVRTKTGLEPLIVVDKILTAGGKTVRGPRGGSIQVLGVARDKDGNYQIRFKREDPPHTEGTAPNTTGDIMVVNLQGGMAGGLTAPRGSAGTANMALVDAKGVPLPLISSSVTNTNGEVVHSLTFRADHARKPARLVYSARRTVSVPVPFKFKGLKLP